MALQKTKDAGPRGQDAAEFLVHDRLRLAALTLLASQRQRTFTELREALEVTDGNLLAHLRRLEEAGYVVCRKELREGRPRTLLRITRRGRDALLRYVEEMEEALARAREAASSTPGPARAGAAGSASAAVPTPVRALPSSVAIIMDGNGRWARARGWPRLAGHRAGARTVDRITEVCAERGIAHLALYAFSTENWRRGEAEVGGLWRLLLREIRRREAKLRRNRIRLRTVGRRDRMPARTLAELERVEASTAAGGRMTLWLALDYGGQWDICGLAEEVRRRQREGALAPDGITAADVAGMLPSGILPPVDLLIRTAGEHRLSNFLPWQLAYSELHFTPVLWPDFREEHLDAAIADFAARERRYGAAPPSRTGGR